MDILIDNPETEKKYRQILRLIQSRKNGDVAEAMKENGIRYKMNWGVSLVDLRSIARGFDSDHILALKLWNKQWRETMILATLLDAPGQVSEEQMDYWTKSLETVEMAEQASTNLWVKTPFAFVKALEWCRGKKHLVRFSGIHLMGRLGLTQKDAIDEMFEPFFEEMTTLAKDPRLNAVMYRALIILGSRSEKLNGQVTELSQRFQMSPSESSVQLGEALFEELTSPHLRERFHP